VDEDYDEVSERPSHTFFFSVATPRGPTGAGESRSLGPTRSPTTPPEAPTGRPQSRSGGGGTTLSGNRHGHAGGVRGEAPERRAPPPGSHHQPRPRLAPVPAMPLPPQPHRGVSVSPRSLPLPIPRGASLAMFLTCCSYILPVGREGLGHHLRPARRHRRGNT